MQSILRTLCAGYFKIYISPMKVSETERRRFLETLDHKMVSLDALQRRVAVRAGVKVSAEELDDDIARARAELHTRDARRLWCIDHLAGQTHEHCHAFAQQPGRALRAAVARQDAEVHLGLAELRVLARDANVARHGELAAAAEREAVDRCDHRHAQAFERARERLTFARLRLAGARVGQRVELADVRARGERLRARAGEDHGAERVVRAELSARRAQLVEHPQVKSV